MLTATRAGWVNSFRYDAANRVDRAVQNGKIVAYGYGIAERTRTVTYPGGRSIIEHTDPRGRLSTITDVTVGPVVRYDYDPGNRVPLRAAFDILALGRPGPVFSRSV